MYTKGVKRKKHLTKGGEPAELAGRGAGAAFLCARRAPDSVPLGRFKKGTRSKDPALVLSWLLPSLHPLLLSLSLSLSISLANSLYAITDPNSTSKVIFDPLARAGAPLPLCVRLRRNELLLIASIWSTHQKKTIKKETSFYCSTECRHCLSNLRGQVSSTFSGLTNRHGNQTAVKTRPRRIEAVAAAAAVLAVIYSSESNRKRERERTHHYRQRVPYFGYSVMLSTSPARSVGVTPADMLLKIVKVPGLALLATIGFLSVSFFYFFLFSSFFFILVCISPLLFRLCLYTNTSYIYTFLLQSLLIALPGTTLYTGLTSPPKSPGCVSYTNQSVQLSSCVCALFCPAPLCL